MATASASLQYNITTDANFRAWVAGISALLQTASGLVKTGDTGQIDAATVLAPTAINTSKGYEIYRFNDTLQATKPVFIKIEYGSSGAVGRPSLWITVGTATDGAGTLSGQLSTRTQLTPSASVTAAIAHYASVGTDRLMLLAGADNITNTYPMLVVVERTRDATGTATGDGIVVILGSGVTANSSSFAYQVIPFSGAVPAVATAAPAVAPGLGGIPAVGADVGLSTPQIFVGKPFYILGLVMGRHTELGSGSFTATVLGATHTYLAAGVSLTAFSMTAILGGNNIAAWAVLWE